MDLNPSPNNINKNTHGQRVAVNKDALLKLQAERKFLISKFNQAVKERKALYDKIAELDVTKKIEISDLNNAIDSLKREIADISSDKESLLTESESLMKEISEKDGIIKKLSTSFEINNLQFKEFRGELLTAAGRLREWESRYNELEAKYIILKSGTPCPVEAENAMEGVEVVEIAEAVDAIEIEGRIETLEKVIFSLQSDIDEKSRENVSLKKYIAQLEANVSQKANNTEAYMERNIAKVADLEIIIAEKNTFIKELEAGLHEKQAIEKELERARKDLEMAFKHRINEVKALKEHYELDLEKLRNENINLDAQLNADRDETSESKAELAGLLNKEKAKAASFIDALTVKDNIIEDLSERFNALKTDSEDIFKKNENMSAEAETLRKANQGLSEKITSLEVLLSKELSQRENIEKELEEHKNAHRSEVEISIAEKERVKSETAFLKETVRWLEDSLTQKERKISEIESSLVNRQAEHENLRIDREKLTERLSLIQDGIRRDGEIFTLEKKVLESALDHKNEKITELSELIVRLHAEKDALQKISNAADGHEQSIQEGNSIVQKPDNDSGTRDASIHDYPETLVFIAPSEGRLMKKIILALSVMAILFSIGVLGFYFKTGRPPFMVIPVTKSPEPMPEPATVESEWAAGVKHKNEGVFDITLTFLNREALSILGISNSITDEDLMKNHYALLEIKTENGCISKDFSAAPNKNVSFLDAGGTMLASKAPILLADEGRAIYKTGACNGEPGAVLLEKYLSIGKERKITGLAVKELSTDASPIIIK